MRAILQTEYGGEPEQVLRLVEIDRPTIGSSEVLVQVAAASVDRGTWHLMTGRPELMRLAGVGFRRPKASNPGRSLAGTVVSAGNEVAGVNVGDEGFGTGTASFAEFARAPADRVARKPTNLTFEHAATVPISGPTALQAVRDRAKVCAGERVLVIGASGGVGTYAVQIAKAFGAEVTAVSSTAKVDLMRTIGADQVIDYTREEFADAQQQYDVILDIGGNTSISRLRRALTPRGRLVIVGGETGGRWLGGIDRQMRAQLLSPFVGQTLGTFLASENATDLVSMRDLIEAGTVVPVIDGTYPLGETAGALRRLIDGHPRGKVVISVADS